jgi:hypothetical protein
MSSANRWEWSLPAQTRIAATLDVDTQVESVYVGERLASQAARGTKPEGHAIPFTHDGASRSVVVTFDRQVLVCVLRLDDMEVAPELWPVRKRGAPPPPQTFTFPTGMVLLGLLVVAAGVAFVALRARAPADPGAEPTLAHRSDNGLLVAHFPATFAARRAVVPSGIGGVVLEERPHADAIVILALPASDPPHEPWLLQRKLHGEAVANVPRGKGGYEETARSDGTCFGQPAAVVRGRMKTVHEQARVWSCAFVKDDAGYLAMVAVRESATAEEETRLRATLDATELTHLGELSAPP